MSPSLIEMGFFFFLFFSPCITDLLTVCFLIVTKGHRAERRETREPAEEGDGATKKKTRVSGKEVVSTEKNELISSGCRRMEMSRKAEYLINKMLKY